MKNYLYWRSRGFTMLRSFELAFSQPMSHFIIVWLLRIAIVAIFYNLAMGLWEWHKGDVKQATIKQAVYVNDLENMLAYCLSEGDQPLWVGDEMWYCGAVRSPTGFKRPS